MPTDAVKEKSYSEHGRIADVTAFDGKVVPLPSIGLG